MKVINCLVVEDEPIAAELLQEYIRQVPFLSLHMVCMDAFYAMEALQIQPIDVIFLDIHLPRLRGLDFLKTLKAPPKIILTTAYQEYALQGYELNVVDYLLKPIEFNRFLAAINKLGENANIQPASTAVTAEGSGKQYLFLNVNKKQVKIYVDEIVYVESLREYIKVHTSEKSILTKMQIREIEEVLPRESFLRVHRSFLVAKQKIEAFSPAEVDVNGIQIRIGRNYRELVLASLQKQ